jgi:prolyl-tRNA synthetase
MGMTVLNDKGEAVNPIMGCYGIGVGRAIASIAQESNDDKGLILPMTVAPYKVHLTALRIDDEAVKTKAFEIYNNLQAAGIEVLFDDRTTVSNGVKFADADLMGMPLRLVVSPRALQNDEFEIVNRKNLEITKVSYGSLTETIKAMVLAELELFK